MLVWIQCQNQEGIGDAPRAKLLTSLHLLNISTWLCNSVLYCILLCSVSIRKRVQHSQAFSDLSCFTKPEICDGSWSSSGCVTCTFQMTIMLRSSSLHFLIILVMSAALSSEGTGPWLLLLDDVLDDATSSRWDSEVWQQRKKKSPQGVEELMICTNTVARDKGKAKKGKKKIIHRNKKWIKECQDVV